MNPRRESSAFKKMRAGRERARLIAMTQSASDAWEEHYDLLRQHRSLAGVDSAAWLEETRQAARIKGADAPRRTNRPGLFRRFLNFTMGMEPSA